MLGNLVVKLGLNSKGFTKGLDQSQSRLGTFSKKVAGGAIKVGAAMGTAVAAGVSAAVFQFAKYGDQMDKMAQRTGFTTNALSELGFAAEQSGFDIETLEKGIVGMDRFLLNAERKLSTATDSLDDLGLTMGDLQGLSPEDQFMMLAGAVADVEDPSKRAALAMSIFGKAGQKMIPLLNAGSESIEEMRQQARDLGISMSPEDAKAAAEFTDAWNRAKKSVMGFIYSVGGPFIRVFTRAVDIGVAMIKDLKDSFGGLIPSIDGVGRAFLKVTLGFVSGFNEVVHFFVAVIPAVLSGFAQNWRSVFKTAYDYVTTIFTNMGKNIARIMGSIWDHIASGGKTQLDLAWKPLAEGFESSMVGIEIPQRMKTGLERELERQLGTIGQDAGEKAKKGMADGMGIDEEGSGKSSKLDKMQTGAAMRGSSEAISAILRNVSGTKNKTEEQQLKEQKETNKKLNKMLENDRRERMKKPQVAIVGRGI